MQGAEEVQIDWGAEARTSEDVSDLVAAIAVVAAVAVIPATCRNAGPSVRAASSREPLSAVCKGGCECACGRWMC